MSEWLMAMAFGFVMMICKSPIIRKGFMKTMNRKRNVVLTREAMKNRKEATLMRWVYVPFVVVFIILLLLD